MLLLTSCLHTSASPKDWCPDLMVHLVGCAGNGDDTVRDAMLVVLSFTRAHAPWLEQHYGPFQIDPRRRSANDWAYLLSHAVEQNSGSSFGAAAAGETPIEGEPWVLSSSCVCLRNCQGVVGLVRTHESAQLPLHGRLC